MVLAGLLAAGAARAADKPFDTGPDWLKKPTFSEFQAVWPSALKGSGEAVIKCRANIRGVLEACVVESESPPGKGVGAAALLLAPSFLMKPAMKDGHPVAADLRIPIRMSAQGAGAIGGTKVRVLLHPVWSQAPTAAEVAAAFPRGAKASVGRAALTCYVNREGGLEQCHIVSEAPANEGFGHAARSLAPRFKALIDPTALDAPKVQATVPITFEAASDQPRFLTAPEWRRRPTANQAASVFPAKAARAGLNTGRAVIDCTVQTDGTLKACRTVSEDPPGQDFGASALALAAYMEVTPWSQDGRPTDGAHIQMPIRLNLSAAAPEPAPAH